MNNITFVCDNDNVHENFTNVIYDKNNSDTNTVNYTDITFNNDSIINNVIYPNEEVEDVTTNITNTFENNINHIMSSE